MPESRSKSPQEVENEQGAGQDEKTRLTETEKKQNHIASEQKRREAIRAGFDRLCELVPGLEGQGRSEGLVLKRTVDFMQEQLRRRRELIQDAEARGKVVPEHYKEALAILEKLEEEERERGPEEKEQDQDGSDD